MKERKKPAAKFDKVPSGMKDVQAYKPNEAMQKQIAEDMKRAGMLDHFPEWKKLLEKENK